MRLPGQLFKSITCTIPLLLMPLGQAQTVKTDSSRNTRIIGSFDSDLALPAPVLPLAVTQDATALQAILDFLKTVHSDHWTGVQATGMYSGFDSHAPAAATLTVKGRDSFRLDISASEGDRSIRIEKRYGQILESDGHKHMLTSGGALNGIFMFPRLLDPSFVGQQTAVLDRGLITIDGKSLQRITIENFSDQTEPRAISGEIDVVDVYFDPLTHLLAKSVTWAQLDFADRARYVQAVSYDDYQKVDNILLPLRYQQTLNGQLQWTLQLANVQLKPFVQPSYFHF